MQTWQQEEDVTGFASIGRWCELQWAMAHNNLSKVEIAKHDMLFDIPYIADWNKIGDYRQCQTDLNTKPENRL